MRLKKLNLYTVDSILNFLESNLNVRLPCHDLNEKNCFVNGRRGPPLEVIRKLINKKITFFCLIFEKNPVSKMILKNHKLINFVNNFRVIGT